MQSNPQLVTSAKGTEILVLDPQRCTRIWVWSLIGLCIKGIVYISSDWLVGTSHRQELEASYASAKI